MTFDENKCKERVKGKVIKVVHGAVNSEITLELPGGQQIVSIITKTSAERLGLKKGWMPTL